MIDTSDIARHDACPRFQTWSSQFELPRVPLAEALHLALREGLLAGVPSRASTALMALASSPGLDIEGRNVYDVAQHHASLLEVICAYLLAGEGAWNPCGAVEDFQPMSFLMNDGRLRRVVLCSAWSPLREADERHSWWTVADTVITGRPMLLNAIVIGQSRSGFRLSPWTTGFIHPENATMRIKKKEGRFTENWKRVYREATDYRTDGWLRLMQQDNAFEDIVHSVTVEVPPQRKAILSEISQVRHALGSLTMRRSNCFRYGICPMFRLCHHPSKMNPEIAGWHRSA